MEKNILSQFKNYIPQFMWWKDLESKFLGCNENFAKFTGWENEQQLIGKTDYDCWNKDEAAHFRKIDKEVIVTGKSKLNFEEYITIPKLGKRWLSTSKIPLYDDKNEIIGTIGWFSDITTLKEMQIQLDETNKTLINYSLQLEQTNNELELANMDLVKFTYAASHDLKEPIRNMKIFSTLLKKHNGDRLDAESLEYIDYINKSANRMGSFIEDTLSYALTGASGLKAEQTDINNIIKTKLIDLEKIIETKAVKINLNLPSKKINCYPNLIGIIFYNLINNAIKFNESKKPTITCDYIENEQFWIFSITDNGIGIDSKHDQKIFEPFKRLARKNYEGSGIGLSVCKRVATLHKGDIWLEESTQGNTVFKFSISKHLK